MKKEASLALDYQRMEAALQSFLGHQAAVRCCSTDGDVSSLDPIERSAIAGAITRRQKEFAAGRIAARDAMRRLGKLPVPIPIREDRSPQWPDDLVGSIAHSHAACVSVVAIKSTWKAVGVDLEADQGLPRELWELVGVPSELQRAAALPLDLQARWMLRVFSAKEAYYKCMFPQVMRVLEFHEAEIVMDATLEGTVFQVHPHHRKENNDLPKQLSGHLLADQGLVTSLIIL